MTIKTLWSAASFSSGLRSHLLESNLEFVGVPMESGPLNEMANHLIKLNMFPYFEGIHGLLSALYVRHELGTTAHRFSRRHPFSCWASTMLAFFAGTFIANFLLAEPLVEAIKSTNTIVLATFTWYLVFYSPFDLVYKLTSLKPFYILMNCAREVLRAKVIYLGVTHSARVYPGNFLIIIAIGTIRASGGFIRPLDRLFRGVWTPNATEMLNPSYSTKTALLASTIFTIHKQTNLIDLSTPIVYLGIVILLIYLDFSSFTFGAYDPFRPIENLTCSLLFGNSSESLEHIQSKSQKSETDKSKSGVGGGGTGDKVKRGDAKKKE